MFKILLLGTNRAVINDFFTQLSDSFELLSSSLRYEDVMAHIKYVDPDAIIYCLKNDTRDNMSHTVTIKNDMKTKIPFFIIGNESECHDFNHCAVNVADYSLIKPLNAQKIKHTITNILEKNKKIRDASKAAEIQQTVNTSPDSSIFTIDDDELNSLMECMEQMEKEVTKTAPSRFKQPESSAKPQVNTSKPQADTGKPQANIPKPPTGSSSSRKHILIVDDDVQMQRTIKHQLEETYDVATAITGKIALRFIQNKHTDLILLDYEMPEMNGSEVLEQIRANPATKHIPVIFLTGIADREKIKKALSMNPQGYVLKPADKESLLKMISDCLK